MGDRRLDEPRAGLVGADHDHCSWSWLVLQDVCQAVLDRDRVAGVAAVGDTRLVVEPGGSQSGDAAEVAGIAVAVSLSKEGNLIYAQARGHESLNDAPGFLRVAGAEVEDLPFRWRPAEDSRAREGEQEGHLLAACDR